SKSVGNDNIFSNLNYKFAYNIQQKSHTNISVNQIWELKFILFPKISNGEEYIPIMSDVMITNIPPQSLKCVTILSKLQLNSSEQQIPAQIPKPTIMITIDDQRKSNFQFIVGPSNQLVTSNHIHKRNKLLHGFSYTFNLHVKTEHLLPSPFKTDCMNYEKNIGKTNEYKSFHECEEKCKNKIKLSLSKSENFNQIG